MAFSSSVKRSQNILVCGLCDVNTKVKVKCMDCDLYLCDNCEERHSRFKHSDSHSVIPLRDIHLHKDEEEEEFKPVKCKDHKKQFCSIFCRTCDHLICPICIVETHQKHDLEKIEIMCERKCEELEDFENDTDMVTKKYLQVLHFQSKCCEVKRNLEAKIKAIQGLNSRHAKELREIKDLEMQSFAQDTSEIENRISNEQEVILKEKEELEQLLESKNIEKFLDAASNLKTRLKTFHGTMKSNKQRITTLQSISGDYTSAVSTFTNNNIKFTKLESFPMESFSVISLTSNQMNSVWIADNDEGNIQHLELKKDIKIVETNQLPEGDIIEIRCSNDNEIILTRSTKISRMTADGKFETFKDFSPFQVFTLYVTTNGNIVVGMNIKDIDKKKDELVIVILGKDGKTLYEYRNFGGQLLKNDAVRSCTVLDGDVICYIDSAHDSLNGRLVVLNKSGYIQWTYNGNSKINTEHHPFTPIEVISTKNNNLIASDEKQNVLHILSSTGSLLTLLDLTLLGIKEPGLMTLVWGQYLWVHDNYKENKRLFKLEISGI